MATTLNSIKVATLLLCGFTAAFLIGCNKLMRLKTSTLPKMPQKISNLSTWVTRLRAMDTGDPKFLKAEKKNLVNNGGISIENGTCAMSLDLVDEFNIADGEECKLPNLDPHHPDIMKVLHHVNSLNCTGRMFTQYKNNVLRLLDDVSEAHQVAEIVAQPIIRVADSKSKLGDKISLNLVNREAHLNGDFLKVTAHFKNGSSQADFHASISEDDEVKKRKEIHSSPLNIMILVFDGTSGAHFQRMLPGTYAFLKDKLDSIIFQGYSIVGESTTPAMSALLTGYSVQDNCRKFTEGRRGIKGAGEVDEWPFIFHELKRLGFATMWSEDQPILGAFHLRLMGFRDQPVDHYGRILWLRHVGLCLGSQPQYQVQLKYMKSFMNSYPGKRKFGLTFFSDLCHRTPSLVSAADGGLVALFSSLKNENLLNDTMFITMSDHGGRFGDLRQSPQGKLEHRLPFLSVTFPSWFKSKYPEHMAGIVKNTRIITSPFDLHATFKHLLTFPKKPSTKAAGVGHSFFEPLPFNRTCEDAGIPEQYCPCLKWQFIDISHPHVSAAAKAALSYINELLISYNMTEKLCHKLQVKAILEAHQKVPDRETPLNLISDKSGATTCSYQIKFQTTPGDGLFEAFLRMSASGDFTVFGEIDRVNMYGDQPRCIAEDLPHMRPYCLCKY